jgi:type VI secretion system secreted protein VgrG
MPPARRAHGGRRPDVPDVPDLVVARPFHVQTAAAGTVCRAPPNQLASDRNHQTKRCIVEFTQRNRRITVTTPLGEDVLVLTVVDGVERLSELFSYELRLLSDRPDIQPDTIIGENVTITLLDTDDQPYYLNGHVCSFINQGSGDRGTTYTATVVPWLWFLTQRTDCRIFQFKTIPQILEEVFNGMGFTDFDLSGLTGSYDELDYVVQFGETDFVFVSRLMEQEGIFYYFLHEEGKHTLVLGDSARAYENAAHFDVTYEGPQSFEEIDDEITHWEHRYDFRSGRIAFTDYNYETPQNPISSGEKTVLKLRHGDNCELYAYPGVYGARGGGDRRARIVMEEQEAGYDHVIGSSRCRSFGPGRKFKVARHYLSDEEGKAFVLTEVKHHADVGAFVTGGDEPSGYSNDFTALPADMVCRPKRTTPQSIMRGPQTAVVVGPPGEEIYTDAQGRVKVQFHWDRLGQKNENSSCWIRVSQAWAGKDFGGCAIPRIGQEVIVDFLDGDPDRPIVTGRVYNTEQSTPQSLPEPTSASPTGPKPIPAMQGRAKDLPAAKTRTTFKSNSTPGGGACNEIAFDDATGKELFYVNASKDSVRVVSNNEVVAVGNDRELSIGNNLTQFVGNTHDKHVGGNEMLVVGASQTEQIAANRTTNIGANDSLTVGQNRTETVGVNSTETVGATKVVSVGAAYALQVGGGLSTVVGGERVAQIGGNDTLVIDGDRSMTVSGDTTQALSGNLEQSVGGGRTVNVTGNSKHSAAQITVSAKAVLELKCGGSSIKLTPGMIEIKSPFVRINC